MLLWGSDEERGQRHPVGAGHGSAALRMLVRTLAVHVLAGLVEGLAFSLVLIAMVTLVAWLV